MRADVYLTNLTMLLRFPNIVNRLISGNGKNDGMLIWFR